VALPAVGFVLRCQGALVILETEISGCAEAMMPPKWVQELICLGESKLILVSLFCSEIFFFVFFKFSVDFKNLFCSQLVKMMQMVSMFLWGKVYRNNCWYRLIKFQCSALKKARSELWMQAAPLLLELSFGGWERDCD